MTNPYQPARAVDKAPTPGGPEASRFCTWMGMLAAVLATPLISLIVIAAAFIVIRVAGLYLDLDAFVDDRRFSRRTTIWAGVAAAVCGLSAYFAIRSAASYFADDGKTGGVYLLISLMVSSIILVFICAIMLLNLR